MGIQTETNRFRRTRFPALDASYTFLLRILIGSLCCLHLLSLARVITLVLVLRHLIGNHSISVIMFASQVIHKLAKPPI